MTSPRITLNDNTSIPQFGLGVWQVPQEETARVVGDALGLGYRHIDTAQMYGNEAEVAEAAVGHRALREVVGDRVVPELLG